MSITELESLIVERSSGPDRVCIGEEDREVQIPHADLEIHRIWVPASLTAEGVVIEAHYQGLDVEDLGRA
jgi:hypothetical protein